MESSGVGKEPGGSLDYGLENAVCPHWGCTAGCRVLLVLVCRPSHVCVCRVGTPPARNINSDAEIWDLGPSGRA